METGMDGFFENWGLSLNALIPVANFFVGFPGSQGETRAHKSTNSTDAFPIILTWIFSSLMYEKCLHLLLRKMQYPVLLRRKIIDGLWCTGFSFSSIFYLKLLLPQSIDSICIGQKPRYLELGYLLHKCFYMHRGGIEIFIHGSWLRGWTNFLFCLIIHSSYQQKSYDLATNLLIFKASSMAFINICRIFSTVSNKRRTHILKILLVIYAINWVYIHSLVVPHFTRWNSKGVKNDLATLICMWLWLLLEFINEVQNIRLGCINSSQFIDAYLFLPPSQESIELQNICKKLREAQCTEPLAGKDDNKVTQLWKTLACAMVMKKKIKKLREEGDSSSTSESGD